MTGHRNRRPDQLGDPLGEVVRGMAQQRTTRPEPAPDLETRLGARLDALEHDLGEVRTRINALFFAVLTAALGDLVGRLML